MTTPPNKPKRVRAYAAARALPNEPIDVEVLSEQEALPLSEPTPPAPVQPVESAPNLPAVVTQPGALVTMGVGELAEIRAKALEFIESVLIEGIDADYAVIPGCGGKRSLLQPGAQKLARFFMLSVATFERTMLEQFGDTGFTAGYVYALAGPDGRVWGQAEAFASEAEKTFDRLGKQTGGGVAMLNALTARAQKRAFVRAVMQSTGISDLFIGDLTGGDELLNEEQRAIYHRIYELVLPRRADMALKNAARIKQAKWAQNLGAAVDDAADVRRWTPEAAQAVVQQLLQPGATVALVDELLGGEAA